MVFSSRRRPNEPSLLTKRGSASRKTRARIIKVATKLFAERGFDATPTSAIAEEAGVPNGLIFYHFNSKEGLLDEIFRERGLPEELARVFGEIANQPPPVALKAVAVHVFRWLDQNEDRMRLYFKEMTSHRPVSSRLRDSRLHNIAHVAAYLDAAIDRKEMAPANTRMLAQFFISSLLLAAIFDRDVNVNTFARILSETIAGAGNRRTPRR